MVRVCAFELDFWSGRGSRWRVRISSARSASARSISRSYSTERAPCSRARAMVTYSADCVLAERAWPTGPHLRQHVRSCRRGCQRDHRARSEALLPDLADTRHGRALARAGGPDQHVQDRARPDDVRDNLGLAGRDDTSHVGQHGAIQVARNQQRQGKRAPRSPSTRPPPLDRHPLTAGQTGQPGAQEPPRRSPGLSVIAVNGVDAGPAPSAQANAGHEVPVPRPQADLADRHRHPNHSQRHPEYPAAGHYSVMAPAPCKTC